MKYSNGHQWPCCEENWWTKRPAVLVRHPLKCRWMPDSLRCFFTFHLHSVFWDKKGRNSAESLRRLPARAPNSKLSCSKRGGNFLLKEGLWNRNNFYSVWKCCSFGSCLTEVGMFQWDCPELGKQKPMVKGAPGTVHSALWTLPLHYCAQIMPALRAVLGATI